MPALKTLDRLLQFGSIHGRLLVDVTGVIVCRGETASQRGDGGVVLTTLQTQVGRNRRPSAFFLDGSITLECVAQRAVLLVVRRQLVERLRDGVVLERLAE